MREPPFPLTIYQYLAERGANSAQVDVAMMLIRRLVGVGALLTTLNAADVALSSASAREMVSFRGGTPGMIVVRTHERRLYLVTEPGRAIRYPVGVGRAGKQWSGSSYINGKFIRPAWAPPEEIRRDRPGLPSVIPSGSPSNPMGAAAMTLAHGEYAIHGTNQPGSIGGYVSYGCIRMYNQDIMDLYSRVSVGTTVVVER